LGDEFVSWNYSIGSGLFFVVGRVFRLEGAEEDKEGV